MDPLVTVDELADKLPFVMSEDEQREALRSLEELSDDARHYGSAKWVTSADTPRSVSRLVIKAAARHMKNYEGFVTSRAGDETVSWSERGETPLGDAQFTKDEKARLRELSGRGPQANLHSVGLYHSTNRPASRFDPRDFVPTNVPGERLVPYGDPTRPW